jgi:hypothetical protein
MMLGLMITAKRKKNVEENGEQKAECENIEV